MDSEHTPELDTLFYMMRVKNPLCTVGEITKHLTGRWTDSNDADYRKTYRMLEKMLKENLLFGRSTKNGGNVYIARSRVTPATKMPDNESENYGDLPF